MKKKYLIIAKMRNGDEIELDYEGSDFLQAMNRYRTQVEQKLYDGDPFEGLDRISLYALEATEVASYDGEKYRSFFDDPDPQFEWGLVK